MARIEMQSRDMQRRPGDMLTAVLRGDEVVITRFGRPVALVVPYPDEGADTEPEPDLSSS